MKNSFAKSLKKVAHAQTEEEIVSSLHKAYIKRQISMKARMSKI